MYPGVTESQNKEKGPFLMSFLSAPLPAGDVVLSGCSTLSLLTPTLQQLNHVFELHLGPWGPGQTGFVALPSHPTDSPVILQLQFLFDVLQKTLSLKVLGWEWGRRHKKPRRVVRVEAGGVASVQAVFGTQIQKPGEPRVAVLRKRCQRKGHASAFADLNVFF